jgi:hypothetical protein
MSLLPGPAPSDLGLHVITYNQIYSQPNLYANDRFLSFTRHQIATRFFAVVTPGWLVWSYLH